METDWGHVFTVRKACLLSLRNPLKNHHRGHFCCYCCLFVAHLGILKLSKLTFSGGNQPLKQQPFWPQGDKTRHPLFCF